MEQNDQTQNEGTEQAAPKWRLYTPDDEVLFKREISFKKLSTADQTDANKYLVKWLPCDIAEINGHSESCMAIATPNKGRLVLKRDFKGKSFIREFSCFEEMNCYIEGCFDCCVVYDDEPEGTDLPF